MARRTCTGCGVEKHEDHFVGGRTGKCAACNVVRANLWIRTITAIKRWFK